MKGSSLPFCIPIDTAGTCTSTLGNGVVQEIDSSTNKANARMKKKKKEQVQKREKGVHAWVESA